MNEMFRDLNKEEKKFLMTYNDEGSMEDARRAADLIDQANIQSLCEIVMYSRTTDICAILASYLNDNADKLGFTRSCAVEKMARVKRSPWALNQFRLTPDEAKFVEETAQILLQRVMEEGAALHKEFDVDRNPAGIF